MERHKSNRTLIYKGKRINLGRGQATFGGAKPKAGVEPTLQPTHSDWVPPTDGGAPHERLGLFPHDEIRQGQRRFARDVTLAVQKKQHLVAQAPTGIGKTAASLAPALQVALDQNKVIFFLTSRQSQHKIAIDTLRKVQETRGARFTVVDLVGKRDMCLRREAAEMHPSAFPEFCSRETRTKSCSYLGNVDEATLRRVHNSVLHVEELMAVSRDAGLCPHLVAMESAKNAQVVVADYNHLFSDIREQSLERLGVNLEDIILIVDEAHNVGDRIRQSHAHRITDFLLDQVKAEAKKHRMAIVEQDCNAIREAMIELAAQAEREGRAEQASISDEKAQVARLDIPSLHAAFETSRSAGSLNLTRSLQDAIEDLAPLVKEVRKGQNDQIYSEQLLETLEDWGRFQAGALRYVEWDEHGAISLHVRLLDASIPARRVFDQVHSAILMSGTLKPPEMTRDLLGLQPDRTTVRVYPTPFPPENRAIVVQKGVSTRFQDRSPALWERIGLQIRGIAESCKGNVAVFAPSYSVLTEVRTATQEVTKLQLLEEPGMSKPERDNILDALLGAKKRNGAVLWGVMGGSFSEGVDYKDNLLSAVIVVGLPLAPPDLEVQATIGYLDKKHGKGRLYGYTVPAMNKVLQAMGRGIRSETDKCAIVLMDQRFATPPYRDLLPEGAMASDDAGFTLQGFLSGHQL